MAHSQPFSTIVYHSHPSSPLSDSSPSNKPPFSTFQWRGTPPSPLDPANGGSPLSLRQTTSTDFYATQELSPSAFSASFTQAPQPQMYTFSVSDPSMDAGHTRQIESSVGPRRVFARRRSARQQRLRGELGQDVLAFPTESRYELRSARSRPDHQPFSLAPISQLSDSSDQSRDFEAYSSSQFSSPSSSTVGDWPFQPFESEQRSFSRATSPTLSSGFTSSSSGPPLAPRKSKKKRRISSKDKLEICRMHASQPEWRQQDIAAKFAVERSTVSKILKEKERWLNQASHERRSVDRFKLTKFPQLEGMMQEWLVECAQSGKPITDAAIREKAKDLVPELVISGGFKASAGWLDNFKQRNGIRQGRLTKTNLRALDNSAAGGSTQSTQLSEESDNAGTLDAHFTRAFLERESASTSPLFGSSPSDPAGDVEMGEDLQTHQEPSFDEADSSVDTMPMTPTASTDTTPAADVAAHDAAVASMDVGAGGVEDQVYTQTDGLATDVYPATYENPPTQGVDAAMESVMIYVNSHPILQHEEIQTLMKVRAIIFDHVTTGFVDRSRFLPEPSTTRKS